MSKKRVSILVLFSFIIPVLVATAAAQVPMPTGIECVPVPGMPCPGSRASSGGSLSSDAAFKQQLAADVADIFVRWLFSSGSDPKAAAQKQHMMEELQQRKAEAERQHNLEEARRLEAICNRLSATLKLNGLPSLQMKDVGSSAGGLQLKLGDSNNEHAGIQGLPGIALNDNTGNGGGTPYGISGLPGIYTNGPGSSSGTLTESKLQLKTGEESAPLTQTATSPVPATSAPADGDAVSRDWSRQCGTRAA